MEKEYEVYIAIGSNIGEREYYINKSIEMINLTVGKVHKIARFIETEPYGYEKQGKFINTVICITTKLSPKTLLKRLNYIEEKLGRVRDIRWGPRTIDLDIIFYDNLIIDEEELHIPHIDFMNRDFVLLPLVELNKNKLNPRNGKTVYEILCEKKLCTEK